MESIASVFAIIASWPYWPLVICLGAFGILAACMVMMGQEEYENPVCETCGRRIEEGADIEEADSFLEAPPGR